MLLNSFARATRESCRFLGCVFQLLRNSIKKTLGFEVFKFIHVDVPFGVAVDFSSLSALASICDCLKSGL